MRMLASFAGALALLAASVASAEGTGIDWKGSYEEALQTGKSSGKMVMVDFYTDW